MATRVIVTSQPEVACDVCARRLLRGEQPERFMAGGRECVVCELCTARARSAGWVPARESDRGERGEAEGRAGQRYALRGLIGRLRSPAREPREPAEHRHGRVRRDEAAAEIQDFENAALGSAALGSHGDPAAGHHEPAGHAWSPPDGAPRAVPARRAALDGAAADQAVPFDGAMSDGDGDAGEELSPPWDDSSLQAAASGHEPLEGRAVDLDDGTRLMLEDAVALFNTTEAPRRIVGVARSLGAPSVTVRPAPADVAPDASEGSAERGSRSRRGGAERVAVIAAWELCWYRWEVDLAAAAIEARLVAQGTELDELSAEDLLGNAAVDRNGSLRLA
ncbi:MAG: hypothetical protein ACYDA6_10845 [Solirubrobacteraceae bacterium]